MHQIRVTMAGIIFFEKIWVAMKLLKQWTRLHSHETHKGKKSSISKAATN